MKNKICLSLIPALFIVAGLFLACSEATVSIQKKSKCTVTFNTLGGVYPDGAFDEYPPEGVLDTDGVYTATVRRNQPLELLYPPAPEKDGYVFVGWFDGYTRYTIDDPIPTDFTLTARWVLERVGGTVNVEYFTVTFNTDSAGAVVVPPVQVVKNEPLLWRFPQVWRTGYTFDGWFDELDAEFTSTIKIVENMTVKAKWTAKAEFEVTFDAGAGNSFPTGMESEGTYETGTVARQKFKIMVYDGDGIYDRLPTKKPLNHDSPASNPEYYFLVYWIGGENLPYVENVFIPITGPLTLTPKWGAPDISVPLKAGEPNSPTLYNASSTDCNPQFRTTTVGGKTVYTIRNAKENNSTGRWEMLYWIELNLPADFSIRYYNKYTVNCNFYGNVKATESYRKKNYPGGDTLLPEEFYIKSAGQQMSPNRHGYGQISFCISNTGNGASNNDKTIFQQYNLGMGQDGDGGTINSTWKPVGGEYPDPDRPSFLLIQTSDDWIGFIEVTEIRFHNDADSGGGKD